MTLCVMQSEHFVYLKKYKISQNIKFCGNGVIHHFAHIAQVVDESLFYIFILGFKRYLLFYLSHNITILRLRLDVRLYWIDH